MVADFYPPLDARTVTSVRAVVNNLRRDKGWLDGPDCPYDSTVRAGLAELMKLLPTPSVPVSEEPDDDEDKYASLERDTRQMLNDLKLFSQTLSGEERIDPKERMQFFRTAVSLMDKLVGLSERALNLKHVSDFQRAVMNVFDQVLDAPQRTQALKLLDEGASA